MVRLLSIFDGAPGTREHDYRCPVHAVPADVRAVTSLGDISTPVIVHPRFPDLDDVAAARRDVIPFPGVPMPWAAASLGRLPGTPEVAGVGQRSPMGSTFKGGDR